MARGDTPGLLHGFQPWKWDHSTPKQEREEQRREDIADLAQRNKIADEDRAQDRKTASIKGAVGLYGGPAAGQIGSMLNSGIPALEAQGAETLAGFQRAQTSPELQARMQAPMTAYQAASLEIESGRAGWQQQQAMDKMVREQQAQRVTNRDTYQKTVQGNQVLTAGLNAVARLRQLEATLGDPNASALDVANAAVLVTQIIEPGLATRNDDRMAVEKGASAGLVTLSNQINQMLSGNVEVSEIKDTIMRTAMNLSGPMMQGTQQALDYWRAVAVDTPGVGARDVYQILGIDEMTGEMIRDLGAPEI